MLQRGSRTDGEEVVNLADGISEIGRSKDPTDAPTGDGVRFTEAVDEDGAVAHTGEGEDRGMDSPIIENVLVNLVSDGEGIKLPTERGNDGQFLTRENLAGGVVRGVENDGLGTRGESTAQFVGIEAPVGRIQSDIAREGTAQLRIGAVVLVKRLEQDDLVA